jgi:hypothetical protein
MGSLAFSGGRSIKAHPVGATGQEVFAQERLPKGRFLSLPVGQLKVDAFHPLYVVVTPPGDATPLELIPVGQLEDLDRWITSWH